ncbi:inactive receptor kinase [Tripterygium wilfordii]|uniref:Inactive receptor kinase n=1 Tax=Tripterygium wilfordii TaxID=458696 RepID=A0A7J7C7H8_TRIWF|nr:inactive receptor kinase [Tripterygium wilfordii]
MSRILIWVLFVLMLVLFPLPADAEDEQVKAALVQFIEKLWGGNAQRNQSWGWNVGSDPCNDQWLGVTCDSRSKTVRKIVLNKLNLAGTLDAVVVVFVAFKVGSKMRSKEEKLGEKKKGRAVSTSSDKPSGISSDYKTGTTRSEYSITSAESGMASSMLVLLTSPVAKRLRFEDLLRAPAELLGRGKHGSLYKVILDDGTIVVVKRIKDWSISKDNFKKRMQRLDQVKHPKVLPAVAFYCSNQEKLLVYEYQQNGSLFNLLHGSRHGRPFDWGSRLNAAGSIAEALQFMHEELWEDGIAHGNLKSLNILFNNAMEPQISEYGLMLVDNEDRSLLSKTNLAGYVQKQNSFNVDIHSFGLILLELLTGKLVHSNGIDLTNWVQSVVREEWTVEVFDRVLVSEGASEERMVNMLQVALKCINPSPSDRPTINQVVKMLNAIKDEEERSISSDA